MTENSLHSLSFFGLFCSIIFTFSNIFSFDLNIKFWETKQKVITFVATTLKTLLAVAKANGRFSRRKLNAGKIYLNFVGNISIPAPEPTPEELEQMEKDRYWKELYRKRRDKELARRKRIRADEKAKKASQFAQTQAELIESFAEDMKDNPQTLPFEVRQVPSA